MLFELIVIAAALALIYVIWSTWYTGRRSGDGSAEAPASDIYKDMATNWNPFNLMVDFTEPIKEAGPDPAETTRIETFKFSP